MNIFTERLRHRSYNTSSVSRARHLRFWLRSWNPNAYEHPHEDFVHPLRGGRHGAHGLRIRPTSAGMRRCLLSLQQTGRAVQIFRYRKYLGLDRSLNHGNYNAGVQVAVLHRDPVAILHVIKLVQLYLRKWYVKTIS